MKGWDPEGNTGPRNPLPDSIQICEPALDKVVSELTSEQQDLISVPIAPAYAPRNQVFRRNAGLAAAGSEYTVTGSTKHKGG